MPHCLALLAAATTLAQSPDADWRTDEAPTLAHHVQLTHPDDFAKAGEQYFDHTGTWIIFQAIPRPPRGHTPDAGYSMYVARLSTNVDGEIIGIEEPILVSPPGSANTCGFFHPQRSHEIIFGSTLVPPADEAPAGYQRDRSDYAWKFPREMRVVTRLVPEIARDQHLKVLITEESATPRSLFERPAGYAAECAYSPDARHVVFASHDPDTDEIDLFVWDAHTNTTTPIVTAPGYDGGPFFSPDGTRICYRSDRAVNDLLQIFVADLAFDDTGAVTGISREHQLTSDQNVSWAPFWHPSGEFLVFTTSRHGHRNYEVYAISVPPKGFTPPGAPLADAPPAGNDNTFPTIDCTTRVWSRRITNAPGFDGLPVFSPDGRHILWTSQRGPQLRDEVRPSSQIWIARVTDPAP